MADNEILVKLMDHARQKIVNGWCKGVAAIDATGKEVDVSSSAATSFCVLGAMQSTSWIYFRKLMNCFDYANNINWVSIADWNDESERTKEEVLEAFDRAIAFCESR